METSFLSFAVVILLSSTFTLTSSQSLFNLTSDQQSLIAFKNTITSPNAFFLTNWSINTPICSWVGVSCGAKHRRVTALNLTGFGLRGTVTPHLGNLTFLHSLDISSNFFTGVLPSELSKLRRLEEINVRANNFTREIPSWLGGLSQLQHMRLSHNNFFGRIPYSLFNISRLRTLDMSFNSLDENVPEEIGNLRLLEVVQLSGNKLRGSIPNAIFNISTLVRIDLSNNSLSGKIPDNVCNHTPKLKRLYLYRNQFVGEIPSGIDKCGELEELSISVNRLTGNIPFQIGNLTMLKFLSLRANEFKGELPEELSKLASLRVIFLGNNLLSGAIPPALFNISTLQLLDLSFNHLSGSLPSNMGLTLFNLQQLALQVNSFSGPIPTSISNASHLDYLDLLSNSFSGSIPNLSSLRLLTKFLIAGNNLTGAESPSAELDFLSSLTNSQNLQLVQISGNPLNGVLPSSIGNLSQSLEVFGSFRASIGGVIPSQIGNLTNLNSLYLHDNQLSGSIPTTIGNLKKLGGLFVSGNQLEGSIPVEFCEMSSLSESNLSNNELEGPIPECLGEMQSLRVIDFSSNKLNSAIPSDFWNLKDLVSLNLSSNYLSGEISSQIGNLKVNRIDFSSNLFSGEIPSSIDGCQSLEYLTLSNNKFGGSIPQSLGNMRGLRRLGLSNNSLSGLIPKSLQDLRFLEYFNVSYNRLEGEIPDENRFANFTAESFIHNAALCGAARFEVPPCAEGDGGSTPKNFSQLMKYILPPLFSTMAIVIIIVLVVRRWRRVILPVSVDTSSGTAWRVTSYIELSRATDSFSEANLLGRGSFGSVFKGIFSDGVNIAVKVFNSELEGANKSFETESGILSTIRHRNLVRIIGCCTNMEFKALILEFMPNGSLEKWLYSDNYCLDILQLLNISIDVASALEYLHHGNTFPIVHCDIKPSNVLLDEDMTARVADFGISKLFEEGETMMQTTTLATVGYTAPEYGLEGKVSTSADVYSFGIMLLEMFTRKKPTDDMFNGEMSLREWVSEALQEKAVNQVLAPALLSSEDHRVEKECVISVFELAMKCLAISGNERMNMIEGAVTLKKIKAKLARGVTSDENAYSTRQHVITII